MSEVAFLITNRYQIHHYKPIAEALPLTPTFVIEERDQDFGVDETFIHDHVRDVPIETIAKEGLRDLDGMHRVIVCQTPVLPNRLLNKSLIVAQQYGLAKEHYQYAEWRSLATLNLMYGPYSFEKVRSLCRAQVVGNPMFDLFFNEPAEPETSREFQLLYLPTYGSRSSIPYVRPHLGSMDCEVIIKLHHMTDPAIFGSLPSNCTLVGPDTHPVRLLRKASAVLSDSSGAAFDALYARKPLLLAGPPAHSQISRDFRSVSTDQRNILGPLSEDWDPTIHVRRLAAAAQAKLTESSYNRYKDRFFANHGSSAKAAAAAIVHTLEHREGPRARARKWMVGAARHRARSGYRRILQPLGWLSPGLARRLVSAARSIDRRAHRRSGNLRASLVMRSSSPKRSSSGERPGQR